MKFREFAESLLGSKVKIKLIRHLLSEEAITSEREIASLIGVSHNAVNKALKELSELNFISPMRVGGATVWQLNKNSYAYMLLKDFTTFIRISPIESLKSMIKEQLSKSNISIKKAIIFGSIAEGKEIYGSDIDLFILVENKNDREKVSDFFKFIFETLSIQIFGNKISLNVMTPREYSNPKNKKFIENVNKGIIVMSE